MGGQGGDVDMFVSPLQQEHLFVLYNYTSISLCTTLTTNNACVTTTM